MEKKQGKKLFLLFSKAESCTAFIFVVGLATVLKRIMTFEWYLPSYFTDLVNLMKYSVVIACYAISGIWSCIMEFCCAHLLACSLIAAFLIAVLYLPGLLRSAWLKK